MARQGELFATTAPLLAAAPGAELELLAHQLRAWQQRLAQHQGPLFRGEDAAAEQQALWPGTPAPALPLSPATSSTAGPALSPASQAARLDLLGLRPQPLSFWRWPAAPQQGAALYFVMDRVRAAVLDHSPGPSLNSSRADAPGALGDSPDAGSVPLLLYVGETARADRRWKGDHDCKAYLAAYSEALHRAGCTSQLSIRFWLDAPGATRARRAVEQALIQRWLPPFNKETRQRWATPFTALTD